MSKSILLTTSPQAKQSLQNWGSQYALPNDAYGSYTDAIFGQNYGNPVDGGNYVTNPGVSPTMLGSLSQWGSNALGAIGGGLRTVGSGIASGLGWNQQTPRLQSLVGLDGDARQLAIDGNQQLLWDQQNSLGKMNAFSNTVNAVGGIGQLYLGFEQLDVAKDNARLARKTFETNLKNSTQSYNTQLQERRRRSIERSTGSQASTAALKSYMDEHGL